MRSELVRQIIHVLAYHPETRDCDRKLMTRFYPIYHPHEFNKEGWMRPGALERMTNPDDLVRLRAVIQNEKGLFLPKDPTVRQKRRQNEDAWKRWLKISKSDQDLESLLAKM